MTVSGYTQKDKYSRYSKHEAGYVDCARSDETCNDCSMYGVASCTYVEGSIHPGGWCRFFEAHKRQNRRTHY
jgi:hypothetical protein